MTEWCSDNSVQPEYILGNLGTKTRYNGIEYQYNLIEVDMAKKQWSFGTVTTWHDDSTEQSLLGTLSDHNNINSIKWPPQTVSIVHSDILAQRKIRYNDNSVMAQLGTNTTSFVDDVGAFVY